MPAKTPELTIKRVRNAFLSAPPEKEGKTELCTRLSAEFGVSLTTLKRYAKEHNWDALRVAAHTPSVRAIAQSSDPTALDISALLCNAINDLSTAALSKTEVVSKEAGYRAMASLVELWIKLNPLTLDELIDAMARTGVSGSDVAKRIRERLDNM